MNTNPAEILRKCGLLILAYTLFSCGASKSGSDLSSRLTPGAASSSNVPLAWCNSGASANYAANQKAFTEANGVWNPQFGYVKFTSVPDTFQNNTRYIQFFRWMASGDGSSSIDTTPLRFRVYDLSTNSFITDWKSSLGWSALASARSSTGMNSVASFFKRVAFEIDIRDPAGEYDVLRTVVYGTDNKKVEQFDALLPVFDANPADYATESTSSGDRQRPQNLDDLHPLKGTALTNSEYTARMETFCDPFKVFN